MKIVPSTLRIETRSRGLTDITEKVASALAKSGVENGTCTVFVRHTSASLVIQENADPAVLRDLQKWIGKVAPESDVYEHDAEGPDDMPAHLRSAITRSSETIPVVGGKLALGTWQAIYVWEHRSHPHTREVVVQIMGI
ncbi:MAG TPA: secondary thiamine-phosphate synthase enzyme YjbQ [Polyangiaceae bacterium]